MNELAKTLILLGILLIAAGLIAAVLGKIPGIGKLPGDITIRRENFTFNFPIVSCILISVILTIIFNLFTRR